MTDSERSLGSVTDLVDDAGGMTVTYANGVFGAIRSQTGAGYDLLGCLASD